MNGNNRYPEEELKSSVVINKINLMSELNLSPVENKEPNPVAFNSKASGYKKEVPQETLKVVNQLFDDTSRSEAVDFSILPPKVSTEDDITWNIKGNSNNQNNNFTKGKENLTVLVKDNEAVAFPQKTSGENKDNHFNLLEHSPERELDKKLGYHFEGNAPIKNEATGMPQVQKDNLFDFPKNENLVPNRSNKNQEVANVGLNEERMKIDQLINKFEEVDKKGKKEDKAIEENSQNIFQVSPKKNNPDDFFNDKDFNFDFPAKPSFGPKVETKVAQSTNIESKPMTSASSKANVKNNDNINANLNSNSYNNPVKSNITENVNKQSISNNIMITEIKQSGKEFKSTNNPLVNLNPMEEKKNEKSTEIKNPTAQLPSGIKIPSTLFQNNENVSKIQERKEPIAPVKEKKEQPVMMFSTDIANFNSDSNRDLKNEKMKPKQVQPRVLPPKTEPQVSVAYGQYEPKDLYKSQNDQGIYPQKKEIQKSEMNSKVEGIMKTNNNLDLCHILDNIQLKDTNMNNNVEIIQENPNDIDIRQFNSNNYGLNLYPFKQPDQMNLSNIHINLAQAESNDINYPTKSKRANGSRENIDLKRNQFLKDDYFSSFRNERNNIVENRRLLSPYLPVESEALTLQVQSIVEDVILNSRDTDIIQQELETLDMSEHSRQFTIGPLIGLDKATYLSGIPRGHNSMRDISREMRGCRMILNDGNGFYRAFMFSVIETFILSKNLYELRKIMFGFFSAIDKQLYRRDVQIDKFEIIIIFSMIISNLDTNNIKEAYDIFIKACNRNHNFDYGIIKYMRIALADYIKANEASIFTKESQQSSSRNFIMSSNSSNVRDPLPLPKSAANSLIPQEYGTNLKSFIDECILSMDYEAERMCIYLAPILFNVNLDIHIVEGSSIFGKKDIIYLKQTFPCLMNEQKLNNFSSTVSLLCRFAHYDRLYSHQMMSENGDHITFLENPQGSQRINSICQDFLCDVCKRQCDLITFSHMPGTDICKQCLIDSVNRIISKRVKYLANDSYDNKEYYCRPIILEKRNNFSINDEDLLLLIGRTIPQHFVFASDNMCLNCSLPFSQENQPVIMPCQCKICPKCIKEMITNDTDGKIILNNFEKMHLKIKPSKCPCGLPFDVDSAVKLTIPNTEEYLMDSNQRLVKYAVKYCVVCRKDIGKLQVNPMQMQNNQQYLKFPIIEESGDPGLHVMCKDCIYPLKADIYDKIKKGQIPSNPKQVPIKCVVCLKKHLVDFKTLKPLLKGDDSACCYML